jgi:hypothetical protein
MEGKRLERERERAVSAAAAAAERKLLSALEAAPIVSFFVLI